MAVWPRCVMALCMFPISKQHISTVVWLNYAKADGAHLAFGRKIFLSRIEEDILRWTKICVAILCLMEHWVWNLTFDDQARATVAEWLRRLTRNQIPSGCAGSNPAGCVHFLGINRFFFLIHSHPDSKWSEEIKEKVPTSVTGLEPAIPRSEVWCLIH